MDSVHAIKAKRDRAVDRLIIGAVLILLVGIPVVGAVYVFDRFVVAPPAIVDQKVAQLETALRETPNNLPLRLRLAGAYSASARYSEAIGQFDEVLRAAGTLKPEAALGFLKTSHLGRGTALRMRGDLDAATADYQAVVDLAKDGEFAAVDVELESAWFQLGSVSLDQGRPADAVAALESALTINRTDADTLHLLGRAYLKNGTADKAVEPLRRAIEFVPIGWCDPYATLADAYAALGKADERAVASAMAAFCGNEPGDVRPSLERLVGGPAARDALVGLGMVAEVRGEPAVAADWYRQAIAVAPDDFTATNGLARVTATEPATSPGHPATPDPIGQAEDR